MVRGQVGVLKGRVVGLFRLGWRDVAAAAINTNYAVEASPFVAPAFASRVGPAGNSEQSNEP